jgi:hypothetical protein
MTMGIIATNRAQSNVRRPTLGWQLLHMVVRSGLVWPGGRRQTRPNGNSPTRRSASVPCSKPKARWSSCSAPMRPRRSAGSRSRIRPPTHPPAYASARLRIRAPTHPRAYASALQPARTCAHRWSRSASISRSRSRRGGSDRRSCRSWPGRANECDAAPACTVACTVQHAACSIEHANSAACSMQHTHAVGPAGRAAGRACRPQSGAVLYRSHCPYSTIRAPVEYHATLPVERGLVMKLPRKTA